MSLPRMQPQDGVAWITGASSGIGEAVALELARRGWTVAITARRLEQLEGIARRSEGLAGRIVAHAGDVTESESMRAVVEGIESVHGPIALAVLNAGVAPPAGAGLIDIAALERALSVNTLGAARGIEAVAERMRQRRRGQIVVNASVVGFGGLPGAAAYGASKAAAIHLCEALKFDCDTLGIRLQLLNPGFIDTPMTQDRQVRMPFLMAVDDAARRIVDGFERGGFEITLPRRLSWPVKFVNLLPYPIYFWLVGKAAGRVRKQSS